MGISLILKLNSTVKLKVWAADEIVNTGTGCDRFYGCIQDETFVRHL